MNHLKGEVLAFEYIPDLGKTFRIYSDDASEDCPRMCKSRFTKSSLRGYPLEDIYAAVGDTKVINSVLVPTIDEQIMLARIIDEEREYDRQGSPSDTWNYWLNVKQKNIWWKELYELDQAARGVLPKKKDKENVTFAEGSSSNSGLDLRLQGLEERILKFVGEGFVGLHKIKDRLTSIESKKEPSHDEDIDFRRWDYGTYEENDKANAEQEAEKDKDNIENTEQEAERKNENSDEEEGEEKEADDNAQQEGEKEKENIEADEQDKEDSESESESETDNQAEVEGKDHQEEEVERKESKTMEQEKEKKGTPKDDHNELRVETNRTDETPTPPRGNQTEGTPTPPRGRTKEMAARRLVTKPMEEEIGKGEKVVEEEKKKEEAVETEEKNREKVAEEEKKEEEVVKVVEEQTGEVVKEQAGEIVEEYTEEEKQRWIVVGYKEAPSPWIMYRCKENVVVAVP
ncbi:unnamed protein product [Brassica oleracea]